MADARRHGSSDAFEAIGAALRDLAAGRPEITVLTPVIGKGRWGAGLPPGREREPLSTSEPRRPRHPLSVVGRLRRSPDGLRGTPWGVGQVTRVRPAVG